MFTKKMQKNSDQKFFKINSKKIFENKISKIIFTKYKIFTKKYFIAKWIEVS